ncbi:YbaK/EbsC family protein [Paucibacter sp. APW11]|uniref:YbaK/EbsC family protein n=1 Tax=Roseateles aquae TaxID=3077235 RepID=A0ABU3P964_9BURK|nr:YbaK/EbsC family protein [Paucibacter sp. APW11]MDT8999095.1 YbaK/EbsC family protein [Paucibacter sp. APW11]
MTDTPSCAPAHPVLPPLLALDVNADLGHPAARLIADWARDYLCAPHQELGRNGPVCPFVPASLAKRLIFATIYEDADLDLNSVKAILLREMARFIALEPVSGNEAQFKSLMVLFPRIDANDVEALIERAQAELQQHFVPNGLMVGEFHAGPPDKRGLWNPEFRPLHSPIPMLVIRHMVPTDILFLNNNAQLFRAYANIYGTAVPERFRNQFEEAAQRFDMKIAAPDQRPAAPRVLQALDEQKASYQVHCHDDFDRPIRTPADFAAALGYELSRITKTLFLKGRTSATHYLLVCSMDKRVDLASLADKLNAGRLEMASLDDLRDLVGYPPTSVTPIGVAGIPVFIDESLFKHATVLTGAGVPRVEIEVSPDTLATLCQARSMAMG